MMGTCGWLGSELFAAQGNAIARRGCGFCWILDGLCNTGSLRRVVEGFRILEQMMAQARVRKAWWMSARRSRR